MSSLVSGFEYDIFISYRHNDNLPPQGSGRQAESGWVTEFVESLKRELAATIKEPISIYFDSNPYDGLLETHNVDKSLEGKLKCLIFIPILSQTYCDQNSFAWKNKFCVFNKMVMDGVPLSSKNTLDHFPSPSEKVAEGRMRSEKPGLSSASREVRLTNGNYASRILPIKIHDLDADDKATIENEIGGVLRAIEFIYKEPGVNRPLKSTDSKNDNQNKTDYKNQVNKVANAIKEIIIALKNPTAQATQSTVNLPTGHVGEIPTAKKPKKTKLLMAMGASILLLAVAGYFLYSKLFSTNKEGVLLDKSIAVLPFADISPTHD